MEEKRLTLEQAEKIMAENNGNLDLRHTGITELPDDLTVGSSLDLSNTGITKLPDNLTIGGSLYLRNTGITKLPDNLTVRGTLDLSYSAIIELPDNSTVGGSLDLRCSGITKLPKKLTVNGFLDLSGTGITELPDNLTVGGYLDLRETRITKLPDNLTVRGDLDLSYSTITKLPDDLTVGGYLDLMNTEIIKLPDNLTVGGSLFLSNTRIKELPDDLSVGNFIYTNKGILHSAKKLHQGDYVPGRYLYADGILTLIKKTRSVGPYTVYVGRIKGKNVVSDGKYYAHCNKIHDGIADLNFKATKDRKLEEYKTLTLDSRITPEEAIIMYRSITGACRQGTQRFVDGLGKLKEFYSLEEILDLTEGQYGFEAFQNFFSEIIQ